MNPIALVLLIISFGLGITAFIVAVTTGSTLNIFWLAGLSAVLGAIFLQCAGTLDGDEPQYQEPTQPGRNTHA